jgi:hypothetical protein
LLATDRVLQDAILAYYGLEDMNTSNHNAGKDDYDSGDDNNDGEYEYEYDE